jgi:MFS family permease
MTAPLAFHPLCTGQAGRAYGFERMMDYLGAALGPLLALGLVAAVGVRWAIGLAVIPGLLAAAAIIYAIRHIPRPTARNRVPLRICVRPVLRGRLGKLMAAIACFEVGNPAASGITGILWTAISPTVAFGYLTAWMLLALTALLLTATSQTEP